MIEEKWAEIPGFPEYAVSNLGQVMNVKFERILKPRVNSYGFSRVVLYNGDGPRDFYVHLLVKDTFEGSIQPPKHRRVMVLESGRIFKTIADCADYIGGHPSSIYRVLRGERPSHLGYTFKYVEET